VAGTSTAPAAAPQEPQADLAPPQDNPSAAEDEAPALAATPACAGAPTGELAVAPEPLLLPSCPWRSKPPAQRLALHEGAAGMGHTGGADTARPAEGQRSSVEAARALAAPGEGSAQLGAAAAAAAAELPRLQPCPLPSRKTGPNKLDEFMPVLRKHLEQAGEPHLLRWTDAPGWRVTSREAWYVPGATGRMRTIPEVVAHLKKLAQMPAGTAGTLPRRPAG
jgi:hypothetical protein